MSCPNATAPVNITKNTSGPCDLKCHYAFKYPVTNLQVTNRGDFISMRPDPQNIAPVTYNAEKYTVEDIRIYRPSLHTYAGTKADGELIIVHNSTVGSGNLLVCVPMVKGLTTNDTTALMDSIIGQIAKMAPSPQKRTHINSSTFTLDKLVPMKPFYSYNGTLPYIPCNGTYSYVVFDKDNAIPLSLPAYASMVNITSANQYSTKPGKNGLYFNKDGPSRPDGGGGDIYIECKPTGSEGEILARAPDSTALFSAATLQNLLSSNTFKAFLGAIVMIVLIILFRKGISKFFGGAKSKGAPKVSASGSSGKKS